MLEMYKKALESSLILPFCACTFFNTMHLPNMHFYNNFSLTFNCLLINK